MATNTYVAIETQTITSTVTEVTFTSIPQTYTDLVLIASPKCDSQRDLEIRVGNGSIDTGSNYSTTAGWANTTATPGSNRNSSATYMYGNYYAGATATAGQNIRTYHFNNYSNTTTFKNMLARSSTASIGVDMLVGTWRSTSAINTIRIFPLSGNIVAGSTFTLYGIANANILAPKAFGGTVTQDATYTYHTFGASGTFTPQQSLTCDYLVVAGGGAGGGEPSNRYQGGGGGAGGLRSTVGTTGGGGSLGTALSLTATSYSITVGAGGAGGSTTGASGSSSTLSTITSVGGGGGGDASEIGTSGNGLTGGSGGGAGSGVPGKTGGSGTTNQGFAGGNAASPTGGAGGGGAGAAAANATTSGVAGNGGAGVAIAVLAQPTGTGVANYYAGGGGGGLEGVQTGGLGGLGGGGNGGTTSAVAGTPNTGSGGGSVGQDSVSAIGANGGSGIVIIRYAN